jgi:hypothetical protein
LYEQRLNDILIVLTLYVFKGCCETDVIVNVGGVSVISGTATGTNTYSLTTPPPQASYSESLVYRVEFTNANTGASTLNIDGLGATPIISSSGIALVTGDILANRVYVLAYDGVSFQIVGGGVGYTTYIALTDATTVNLPTVNTPLATALLGKVDKNAAIVGATKTKITYDTKGLVTSATDATTADIADSTNKRYVTDAQQTVIGNTSGTNTGDNAANTTSNTYADGKVADAIVNGVTTVAPSQNAVFDALATKQPTGNYFDKTADDTDDITVGTINKFATAAEKTKVAFITVTQAVDLDTIESETATNNAKVTNATHTGEVTGSGALTVDKTAITNKANVTAAATDKVLIADASDADNLKYVTAQSIANLSAAATQFQTYPLFGNTVGLSSTRFFSIGGGTGSATESAIEIKIITACTFTGLGIRTSTAQSGTGSLVVTLRKNGANTAITFTIAAGSAAGYFSDIANSVSFAAGDTICIACVNNATATSATVLNGTIVGQ